MIFNLVTSVLCAPDGYSNETQTYYSFPGEYFTLLSNDITFDVYTFFDKSIENIDFNISCINKKIIEELESNGYSVENNGGEGIIHLIGKNASNLDIDSLSVFYDGDFLHISFTLKHQEIYIDNSQEPRINHVASHFQEDSCNLVNKLITIMDEEYTTKGIVSVSPYTKVFIHGRNFYFKKRNSDYIGDIGISSYSPDLEEYEIKIKWVENLLNKYGQDYPLNRIKYKEGEYKDIIYKYAYFGKDQIQFDYVLILFSGTNKGVSMPALYQEKAYDLSKFWKDYESLMKQHDKLNSIENYYSLNNEIVNKLYSEEEKNNYEFIIKYSNFLKRFTENENDYRNLFNLFLMEKEFPDVSLAKEDDNIIQGIKEIRLEAEKIRENNPINIPETIPEEKVPWWRDFSKPDFYMAWGTIILVIIGLATLRHIKRKPN